MGDGEGTPATVRVTRRHEVPERPPIRLAVGDRVVVGRRDTEWPAFVFVETASGSGWVPSRHLSTDSGAAIVLHPYDTTELPAVTGDILSVLSRDDESGWLWCRSEDGREGWVPVRCVADHREA